APGRHGGVLGHAVRLFRSVMMQLLWPCLGRHRATTQARSRSRERARSGAAALDAVHLATARIAAQARARAWLRPARASAQPARSPARRVWRFRFPVRAQEPVRSGIRALLRHAPGADQEAVQAAGP